MITAILLIVAWTAGLPTWASITISVLSGVHFIIKAIQLGMKIADF